MKLKKIIIISFLSYLALMLCAFALGLLSGLARNISSGSVALNQDSGVAVTTCFVFAIALYVYERSVTNPRGFEGVAIFLLNSTFLIIPDLVMGNSKLIIPVVSMQFACFIIARIGLSLTIVIGKKLGLISATC